MSRLFVQKGTGKAKCVKCGNVIKKDEMAVGFKAYNSSGQAHLKCLEEEARIRQDDSIPKEFGNNQSCSKCDTYSSLLIDSFCLRCWLNSDEHKVLTEEVA